MRSKNRHREIKRSEFVCFVEGLWASRRTGLSKTTTDGLSSSSLLPPPRPPGDLGLRPAGAGHEVDRPAHAGAPDIPDAPEHDAALRQTQPPHQHVPLRPEKCQGSAIGGESRFIIIPVRARHKE